MTMNVLVADNEQVFTLGDWQNTGGQTVAELLLMPATRHNFIHFNEAAEIKNSYR